MRYPLLALALLLSGCTSTPDALDRRVDRAVERGVAYLRSVQQEDGSFLSVHERWKEPLQSGFTAMGLLAYLRAGVPVDDPAVQKALAWLRRETWMEKTTGSQTYLRGIVAAAFHEAGQEEDRKRIRKAVELVTDARTIGGGWSYVDKDYVDLSNAHFAMIGLSAAIAEGHTFPKKMWGEIVEYYLKDQHTDKGWGCCQNDRSTVAMTGHVVWALKVCVSQAPELHDEKVEEAIQDGLDWLGKNFWLDTEPRGKMIREVAPGSCEDSMLRLVPYYYFLCLAQAGQAVGTDTFGDHDWYREGAEYLLGVQRPDGSWSLDPAMQTSFAILFLSSK